MHKPVCDIVFRSMQLYIGLICWRRGPNQSFNVCVRACVRACVRMCMCVCDALLTSSCFFFYRVFKKNELNFIKKYLVNKGLRQRICANLMLYVQINIFQLCLDIFLA